MTGQELFYGLSFVDEKYIAEAETARLSSGIPWKKLLPVAACLCILLLGTFALQNIGYKGSEMEAAAPAAPAPESMLEDAAPKEEAAAAPAPTEAQTAHSEEETGATESAAAGELQHVPSACLRVVEVLEDGSFMVVVEAVPREPMPFDVGAELTLVIDPDQVPTEGTDVEYGFTAAVDEKVEIQDGAYDAEQNILYVAGLLPWE